MKEKKVDEIKVRYLLEEDMILFRGDLIELMRAILEDNITQSYPDNLAEQYVDKMSGYIKDGTALVVGSIYENRLIGFSWAYELSIFGERRLHIDMLGVESDFRRNGIAKQMVEMQLHEAKERGITIIEAMSTKANPKSYNWFHSMGFIDERVKVKLELE